MRKFGNCGEAGNSIVECAKIMLDLLETQVAFDVYETWTAKEMRELSCITSRPKVLSAESAV